MVSLSAMISDEAMASLNGLLSAMQEEMVVSGKDLRRLGVGICQSLRARTRKSPRLVPKNEYNIRRDADFPTMTNPRKGKHATHGRANGWTLHRYVYTGKVGTPDEFSAKHFVYAYYRVGRKRRRTRKVSDEKQLRDVYAFHKAISHPGLAKQSWGWAAHALFSSAPAEAFHALKHDRRDPTKEVEGSFSDVVSGPNPGADLMIHNKLDYIESAMYKGAVSDAVVAACNKFRKKVECGYERIARRIGTGGFGKLGARDNGGVSALWHGAGARGMGVSLGRGAWYEGI